MVKRAREELDILSADRELGSYRAAAELCGTTYKTVCHGLERRDRPRAERPPRPPNTDPVVELATTRVHATDGRAGLAGSRSGHGGCAPGPVKAQLTNHHWPSAKTTTRARVPRRPRRSAISANAGNAASA